VGHPLARWIEFLRDLGETLGIAGAEHDVGAVAQRDSSAFAAESRPHAGNDDGLVLEDHSPDGSWSRRLRIEAR